jgi:hypothetical protein
MSKNSDNGGAKGDGSWDQFMRLRDAAKGSPPDPEQPQPDGMPSFNDMAAKGDSSFLTSVRWVAERDGRESHAVGKAGCGQRG